jgi:hypothetical protein
MEKYLTMNEFELNWHFIDPIDMQIPENDLKKIKPLTIEYSTLLWKQWIHPSIHHFMLMNDLPNEEMNEILNENIWGDSKKELRTQKRLDDSMSIDYESNITFFYDMTHAIETCWGIFLKYWSDFCFKGEEGDLIIFHSDPRVIIFVDGGISNQYFWVADRKRLFGLN